MMTPLPFLYTLRNLTREPLRTLQIVLGALGVVFPIMLALAFDAGMSKMLSATGDPQNIIMLSRDSTESLQRRAASPPPAPRCTSWRC